MKKVLILSAVIISFVSCVDDEVIELGIIDNIYSIALVKDYGSIAADGCGWVLEMDSIDFSTYEISDELKQDSLYIFSTFLQTTNYRLIYVFWRS